MTEQDRPRFVAAIAWLAKQYPKGRDSQGRTVPWRLADLDVDAYFMALADESIERLERGVKWHHGHNEFFPDRPASLRKSIEAAPSPPPRYYVADVPALPEQIELGREKLGEIFQKLNRKFGTTLSV